MLSKKIIAGKPVVIPMTWEENVEPTVSVPTSAPVDGRVGEGSSSGPSPSESAMEKVADNVDVSNIDRGGNIMLTSKVSTSVLITEDNMAKSKKYRKKYGASFAWQMNEALARFYEESGIV